MTLTPEHTDPRSIDWATDFDVLNPAFVKDPYPFFDELRGRCPVPHTDRWGGSWMPTTYADVTAVAHDTQHFSPIEAGVPPDNMKGGGVAPSPAGPPPISVDPPVHTWSRRLLLPWFSHRRVEEYE